MEKLSRPGALLPFSDIRSYRNRGLPKLISERPIPRQWARFAQPVHFLRKCSSFLPDHEPLECQLLSHYPQETTMSQRAPIQIAPVTPIPARPSFPS